MTVSQTLLDIRGNVLVPPQLAFGSNTPVSFFMHSTRDFICHYVTEGEPTARRLELCG